LQDEAQLPDQVEADKAWGVKSVAALVGCFFGLPATKKANKPTE
jgi:hypothetical protein